MTVLTTVAVASAAVALGACAAAANQVRHQAAGLAATLAAWRGERARLLAVVRVESARAAGVASRHARP